MASINGVSSSNGVSSLYNSANVISGLASGLDTESMIEGLVQSYQNKINSLSQKATKVEWKQDAYRSIIAKMNAFSSKYTSYTSGTNLMSSSFFNNATSVSTLGKYADKVTASGRTDSDILLRQVNQMATAARYATKSSLIQGNGKSIAADTGLDLSGSTTLGTLSGSLVLTYGSKTVSLSFDEVNDQLEGTTAAEKAKSLADAIEKKLKDQQITLSSGESVSAYDRIQVNVGSDGKISFSDKSSAKNSVYISKASDSITNTLGLDLSNAKEDKPATIQVGSDTKLTKEVANTDYLSGKLMNLSLDGKTKQITMPTIGTLNGKKVFVDADGKVIKDGDKDMEVNTANYTKLLSDAVDKAFNGKVKLSNADESGKTLRLNFDVQEGSELVINTSVGEALGIGKTASTYLNTGKTLGDLLPDTTDWSKFTVAKDKNGKDLLDKNGNPMYEFRINNTVVGNFSKDSTLTEVMSAINSNSDAGVKVSYSKTTKEFVFTAKETGSDSQVNISGGLAEAIFGSTEISNESGSFADAYGLSWLKDGESTTMSFALAGHTVKIDVTKEDTIQDIANKLNPILKNHKETASFNKYTGQLEIKDKDGSLLDLSISDPWGDAVKFDKSFAPDISYTKGQDAEFVVNVNGTEKTMTRSSNSVDIDGLTINFKETFKAENDDEAVSFKVSADADKIVDAVKSMIADYNEMMSEIKSAYSTLPYQKSSGAFANYEPLTDDDKAGMSESAIERYEEKAKQGILFGDRNLSSLYDKMRNIFTPAGEDGALLRKMGITSSYSTSDGSMTITLDESKLREMLDSDPDAVAEVFTRSKDAGASSNGVMQNMKTQLDSYARLTGATKGILVEQAGTPLASLSLLSNTWQKEIDKINSDIESWQEKLSNQVDRYTSQFSRLELLINQMNSQSSMLSGMMMGG